MAGKNFSKNNISGARKESDFYETPYSMTLQLLQHEKFLSSRNILEPSCGHGAISMVLHDNGYENIQESDIKMGSNFLESNEKFKFDYIITNPPFSIALEFILKAKKISTWKIAFLLPLTYLHGQTRLKTIYNDREFPLARVHVFSRYPMLGDQLRKDGKYHTGMQVYAWYVWDKTHRGAPNICWIDNQKYVIGKGDKND